ncbi:hypothetical protein [Ruegeria atlantica]|uniref:hypothetical protein n=1 Tax=Ruegeria atlantica TaxID=81569 RepID=UPI002494191C|nr:hypothetical protein [Ruegeria atlantica]
MNWFILIAHRLLLRIIIAITTLTVALSVTNLVQQLDWNTRSDLGIVPYFTVAGLVAILALLSVPGLNEKIVAPYKARHILIQVAVCLFGGVMITLTGAVAFNAPLVAWLVPAHVAAVLALGCGALYICLGIMGSLHALWPMPDEDVSDDLTALRKVHFSARALASAFAFTTSGIILGSIFVLNSPTTPITVKCSIVMWFFAVVLGSSRLSVADFGKPVRTWNIVLQFFVVVTAIFIIKLTTRALVFHTHLFERLSEIDAVYPRLENLLMLPFIVFGLTSIALMLAREKETSDDVAKVFA